MYLYKLKLPSASVKHKNKWSNFPRKNQRQHVSIYSFYSQHFVTKASLVCSDMQAYSVYKCQLSFMLSSGGTFWKDPSGREGLPMSSGKGWVKLMYFTTLPFLSGSLCKDYYTLALEVFLLLSRSHSPWCLIAACRIRKELI